MNTRYIHIIIPYLLVLFNTLPAYAAAFLEPETRVLFQLPEEYVITRMANDESRITESYEIRDPGTSAQDRFVLEISAEPLEKLLERLRFQSLSSEQLKNREIRGKTAIEAIGKDHETGALGKLIVFSHIGKSIAIQYFGADSGRFEAFISGISFPLAAFSDTLGHVFEKEIASLAEAKIMKGYLSPDLLSYEFRPEAPITRAEFLKVVSLSIPKLNEELINQLNHEESLAFLDIQPDDWFFPFVHFAVELGWVKGYADNTFRPHATITVAEALKLLITSRDIFVEPPASGQQWYEPYFDAMRDLSTPPTNNSPQVARDDNERTLGMTISPGSPLTRSQAAALIVRLENAMETEESSW